MITCALSFFVLKNVSSHFRVVVVVPSVGVEEVARTVRAELGAEIPELFDEFDERAIAAASLAQVMRRRAPRRQGCKRLGGDDIVILVRSFHIDRCCCGYPLNTPH